MDWMDVCMFNEFICMSLSKFLSLRLIPPTVFHVAGAFMLWKYKRQPQILSNKSSDRRNSKCHQSIRMQWRTWITLDIDEVNNNNNKKY